jgi:hypothetical protein
MTQIIYNFDEEGYFTGKSEANIDPLETKIKKKNIYLLPRNATFTKTLKLKENTRVRWDKNNQKWIYEDIKIPEKPKEEVESESDKIDRLKNKAIFIRSSYLQTTDWYILREFDNPNSYPNEVKKKRILARNQINEIEKISNLKEASSIEENYPFKNEIN